MNEISVFPIGKLNHVVVYDCPSSIRKEIKSVFPFISLIVGYILLSLLTFISVERQFYGLCFREIFPASINKAILNSHIVTPSCALLHNKALS